MNQKPTVVVISSSPEQLEILRHWLHELKLEVHPARSCAEAYRECVLKPAPCLVISDVSLSDGNWYFVLERLVDAGLECQFLVSGVDKPSGRMLASGVGTVLATPLGKSKTLQTGARALRAAVLEKKKPARASSCQASGGGSLGGSSGSRSAAG